MSSIGPSPILSSLIQTAQSQRVASGARDRERDEQRIRKEAEDQFELRIAGMDSEGAVRKLPQNDSEEAEVEQEANRDRKSAKPPVDPNEETGLNIDLQA